MDGRTTRKPATARDFHRLADLARERGLQLFRDGERWYCTSASRPGESYSLTGYSCTCQGFVSHQRCTHYALLLERLGWLPEISDETSTPVALATIVASPADCTDCSGCGLQSYPGYALPCDTCGGSGVKVDRRLQDVPLVQPVAAAA